jgi:hypothetical protein
MSDAAEKPEQANSEIPKPTDDMWDASQQTAASSPMLCCGFNQDGGKYKAMCGGFENASSGKEEMRPLIFPSLMSLPRSFSLAHHTQAALRSERIQVLPFIMSILIKYLSEENSRVVLVGSKCSTDAI